VVNQADDDVPHDRTPLFDPWMLIPAIRFPVSSHTMKMASSARRNGFVVFARMKQLHGFAITSPTLALLAHGAKHNAAKRYDRLAALCISAGRSNPQHGLVCRGRANAAQR
jgi:hypothetical protein